MATDLEIADGILAAVIRYGQTRLDVSRVDGLELFDGRGVTLHPNDERDEDDMAEQRELRRADIDLLAILREAVTPLGFALGDEKDGFIQLTRNDLPSSCNAYFLTKRDVPPYAIASLSKNLLTVVVHANDAIAGSYNSFSHPLGVHVVRLRDLAESAASARLAALAKQIAAVRDALPKPEVTQVQEAPPDFDTGKVAEYARTRRDRHFERAVGDIVSSVVSSTFRLGSAFTGLPVPDGILIEETDCAIYDAKSKQDDSYDLGPADADQQNRYLAILERLRSRDGMVPRGVLLFAPHVDSETFATQSKKEFWALIRAKALKLLVVEASALERLHMLIASEGSSFNHFFQRAAFWKALWDQELPGLQGEADLALVCPTRGVQARLVDAEALEVAWLAGIMQHNVIAHAVGRALDRTSPGQHIAERVSRPAVVRSFFAAIGQRDASLATIAVATRLGPRAVRYLVLQEENDLASPSEWGTHGIANIGRLRAEIRRG